MRVFLAAVFVFGLAACGEQKPAPVADAAAAEARVEAAATDAALIAPSAVGALIAGTWRSIDDDKASIIVTADGKWTDLYGDGVQAETFPWRALTGADANVAAPDEQFTPDHTYLEIKRSEATYYYELDDLSPDSLAMFYVGRGNRLAFTRVK